MRATLSADRACVTLKGRVWEATFQVNQLAEQLALYRSLRDRDAPRDKGGRVTKPGPFASHYTGTIEALERVEKMLVIFGGNKCA